MSWSFSYELHPGEEIIEDSSNSASPLIKATFCIILTNHRAMFKFNGVASVLTKSFYLSDISFAKPTRRLFIDYLQLAAGKKQFYLNVYEPEAWARKILGAKEAFGLTRHPTAALKKMDKKVLHHMLAILKRYSLLTEQEFRKRAFLCRRRI